jgi:prepilin-type N-terminal cleavage/methylation domain-containing protein/prepilin-type processing-associated H-X9-DG protein
MKKRAFTLIELLVVIAIIAILAAILFPVFAQAKNSAKKTVDLSNIKQLMLGVMMYSDDNDDMSIYNPYISPSLGASVATEFLWWTDKIMPYVKSKGIFSTPGANGIPVFAPPIGYRYPGTTEDWATTAQITAQGYRVNYTLNEIMSKADDYYPFGLGGSAQIPPDNFTSVSEPASIVYLGPSLDWLNWNACQLDPSGSGQVNLYWDSSLDCNATGSWCFGYETFNMDGNPADAGYMGGANFAYVDGHAKYAKMTKGGDLIYPDPTAAGGLEAGWYSQAMIYYDAGTGGAAGCPENADGWMYPFEETH